MACSIGGKEQKRSLTAPRVEVFLTYRGAPRNREDSKYPFEPPTIRSVARIEVPTPWARSSVAEHYGRVSGGPFPKVSGWSPVGCVQESASAIGAAVMKCDDGEAESTRCRIIPVPMPANLRSALVVLQLGLGLRNSQRYGRDIA